MENPGGSTATISELKNERTLNPVRIFLYSLQATGDRYWYKNCFLSKKNWYFIKIRDNMGHSMTSSGNHGKFMSGCIGFGIVLVLVLLVSGCTQKAATPAGYDISNGQTDLSYG
jgi:hypothetical protein